MKRLLPCLVLVSAFAFGRDWAPQLLTTAAWDSNLSRADVRADEIAAVGLSAELTARQRISLTGADSLHGMVHLAADAWLHYPDLSSLAPGASLEWQHKFGLGAFAPVISVEAGADAVAARDSDRRGARYRTSLGFRRRLGYDHELRLRTAFSDADLRHAVYDQRALEAAVELRRTWSEAWGSAIEVFWRDGDVVSYATPPRPDLVALAPQRETTDTFGRPRVAYSIRAQTVGGRVTLTRTVGTSSAVGLSYEYSRTAHATLRYANHRVGVSFFHPF